MNKGVVRGSLLAIATLLLMAVVWSCQGGEAERRTNLDQERQQLRTEVQGAIDRIEQRIAMLEQRKEAQDTLADNMDNDRVEDVADSLGDRSEEQIDRLEELRDELRDDLDEIDSGAENNWEQFQTEVRRQLDQTEAYFRNMGTDIERGVNDATNDVQRETGTGTGR